MRDFLHPGILSHGLVERANRSIEDILKKYIHSQPKTWDKLLPFILSALRNIAHSGSQISANQLVFGHKIRNLLAIARQSWLGDNELKPPRNVSTVRYLQDLQHRLESTMNLATDRMRQAHSEMKRRYDKHSSTRCFNTGDLVLILHPTTPQKLFTRWRGPCSITRCLQNNNYELDLGHRKAIFHVNMLRRYHDDRNPETDARACNMIVNENAPNNQDGDNHQDELLDPIGGGGPSDVVLGQELTTEQRRCVRELLTEFSDVFSNIPGKTDLMEHKITLTDRTPVYLSPYKIPQELEAKVEEELRSLLDLGIIQYEPNSNYCSPLVIVKKPDGSVRLCNNFVGLNAKTMDERYPTNNAIDLVSRISGALWITRFDLVKAFYQLNLSKESQPLTAFKTIFGSFSYRKMPMGLRTSSHSCQKLLDFVLRGTHRFAASLIDDVITYSTNFDDHLIHIRTVLERFRKAGLTLKAKKCHVAANRINLFGFEICRGVVTPDDEKIQAVKNWAVPMTRKQLQSF